MTPSEIAKSYDQLAEQWNSDEFPRDNGIEQHKRAIAFLKEKRRALDIGCGSSGRIIDLLISRGFDVEGLDRAALIEAYPVDKKGRSNDDIMWFGAKSMYDHAGFKEVARRKPTRPVVRLESSRRRRKK